MCSIREEITREALTYYSPFRPSCLRSRRRRHTRTLSGNISYWRIEIHSVRTPIAELEKVSLTKFRSVPCLLGTSRTDTRIYVRSTQSKTSTDHSSSHRSRPRNRSLHRRGICWIYIDHSGTSFRPDHIQLCRFARFLLSFSRSPA